MNEYCLVEPGKGSKILKQFDLGQLDQETRLPYTILDQILDLALSAHFVLADLDIPENVEAFILVLNEVMQVV